MVQILDQAQSKQKGQTWALHECRDVEAWEQSSLALHIHCRPEKPVPELLDLV